MAEVIMVREEGELKSMTWEYKSVEYQDILFNPRFQNLGYLIFILKADYWK